MDDECRQQRRLCRHLERKYKRTRDQSTSNEWVAQMRKKYEPLRLKRDEYWSKRINADILKTTKLDNRSCYIYVENRNTSD